MDDAVVTTGPPARDVLRENRPASVERIAEKAAQGVEPAMVEYFAIQKLPNVSESEWKLLIAETNDLLSDSLLENLPAFMLQLLRVVFVLETHFMSHLGIGRRQFLADEILWLDGFIQEVENSSMKRGVQLVMRFLSAVL